MSNSNVAAAAYPAEAPGPVERVCERGEKGIVVVVRPGQPQPRSDPDLYRTIEVSFERRVDPKLIHGHPVGVDRRVTLGVIDRTVEVEDLDAGDVGFDVDERIRVLATELPIELHGSPSMAGSDSAPKRPVGGIRGFPEAILGGPNAATHQETHVRAGHDPGKAPPEGPPLAGRIAVDIRPDPLGVAFTVEV